jgi:hypothetical protein
LSRKWQQEKPTVVVLVKVSSQIWSGSLYVGYECHLLSVLLGWYNIYCSLITGILQLFEQWILDVFNFSDACKTEVYVFQPRPEIITFFVCFSLKQNIHIRFLWILKFPLNTISIIQRHKVIEIMFIVKLTRMTCKFNIWTQCVKQNTPSCFGMLSHWVRCQKMRSFLNIIANVTISYTQVFSNNKVLNLLRNLCFEFL